MCPVKALERYLPVRGDSPSNHLLVLFNGMPVQKQHVKTTLKSLFFDHPLKDRLNAHSFRIGAPTAAAGAGTSSAEI